MIWKIIAAIFATIVLGISLFWKKNFSRLLDNRVVKVIGLLLLLLYLITETNIAVGDVNSSNKQREKVDSIIMISEDLISDLKNIQNDMNNLNENNYLIKVDQEKLQQRLDSILSTSKKLYESTYESEKRLDKVDKLLRNRENQVRLNLVDKSPKITINTGDLSFDTMPDNSIKIVIPFSNFGEREATNLSVSIAFIYTDSTYQLKEHALFNKLIPQKVQPNGVATVRFYLFNSQEFIEFKKGLCIAVISYKDNLLNTTIKDRFEVILTNLDDQIIKSIYLDSDKKSYNNYMNNNNIDEIFLIN
ncbi:hypothetical protein CEQ90_20075 [Lewinellaceae bacterium SD302]|nr:hypothetical protein CEQ90_20075 [Lewinellaceae bacterium SD302]